MCKNTINTLEMSLEIIETSEDDDMKVISTGTPISTGIPVTPVTPVTTISKGTPVTTKDYIQSFMAETGLTHKEILESIKLSKVKDIDELVTTENENDDNTCGKVIKKEKQPIPKVIKPLPKVTKPLQKKCKASDIGTIYETPKVDEIKPIPKVDELEITPKVTPVQNPFAPDSWEIIFQLIEYISKGDKNASEMYIGVIKGSFPDDFKVLQQIVYGAQSYDVTKVREYNDIFKDSTGKTVNIELWLPLIANDDRLFAFNKWNQKVC